LRSMAETAVAMATMEVKMSQLATID